MKTIPQEYGDPIWYRATRPQMIAASHDLKEIGLARIVALRAIIDADYPPRRSRWRIVATWVAIGLVVWLWEVM